MIAIVAYNKNFVIAKDNQIPWRISEDFKHFKETTLGCSLIMGRKTYDSLPKKPLPNRLNIVLTRSMVVAENVLLAKSLSEALQIANQYNPDKEVFVIGGQQIYDLAFEQCMIDKVIASEINDDQTGDKFFPNLKEMGWNKKLLKTYDNFSVYEFTINSEKHKNFIEHIPFIAILTVVGMEVFKTVVGFFAFQAIKKYWYKLKERKNGKIDRSVSGEEPNE